MMDEITKQIAAEKDKFLFETFKRRCVTETSNTRLRVCNYKK